MADKKKKVVNFPEKGNVFINASFNNTLITVTDEQGNALVSSSAGKSGFKGTRKATPFAATTAAEKEIHLRHLPQAMM